MKTKLILSPNGYTLLRYLCTHSPISMDKLGEFDQRPLAGMLRRGWVNVSKNGQWISVTQAARNAMTDYLHGKIWRNNPSEILGTFVDNYLHNRRKLVTMRKAS